MSHRLEVERSSGASVVSADATLADQEPALAQLAVASTLGTVPAELFDAH